MAAAKPTKSRRSNKTVAVVFGVLWTAFAACIMFYLVNFQTGPVHPLVLIPLSLVASTPALGAVWMVMQSLKFERHPQRYILIAMFVPFAFVWYYLERGKGRRLQDSVR